MWHEDCFEVFRKLGLGKMILDADFEVVDPSSGIYKPGRASRTRTRRETLEQRQNDLIRLIIYYHQQGEISDRAFYDMKFRCESAPPSPQL